MWTRNQEVEWTKNIMKLTKYVAVKIYTDSKDEKCCGATIYGNFLSPIIGIHPDNICPQSMGDYCNLFKKHLRVKDYKILRCRDCKNAEKGVMP